MTEGKEVYSLDEAADYVGLGLQTFRQYVYKAKVIAPSFTRQELDRFKAARRNGKPKRTRNPSKVENRLSEIERQIKGLRARVGILERMVVPETEE